MKNDDFINLYTSKLIDILENKDLQKFITKEELKDGVLYIVNKQVYSEILILAHEANDIKLKYQRKNESKKKKSENFFQIAKLMNTTSAYKYKVDEKEKYVTITDEKKIKERLEIKFLIWKKKQNKILEDTIIDKKLYDEVKTDLEKEFKDNILLAQEQLDLIINNYDMFKSSLTSYQVLKVYEVLYFTTDDKKTHQEHLRTSVPNILYYTENPSFNSSKRSDKIVDKITKEGKHIFDDFYVEKKDAAFWDKLESLKKVEN